MAFLHHKPCSDVAYSYFGYLKAASIGLSLLAILSPKQIYAADFTVTDGQTVSQQTLLNGDTGTVLSGGTITAAADAITSSAALPISIFNAGTITSTGDDGIEIDKNITDLFNSGLISGADEGVVAEDVGTLTNSGTITGGDRGVWIDNITALTNSGTISGVDDGFVADDVETLTNSGTISGGDLGVWVIDITTLINTGIISGVDDGLIADDIATLTNSGKITGGDKGVWVDNITTLTNTGLISGGGDGITAVNDITNLYNYGTITGTDDAIEANDITNLINNGSITGGNDGITVSTLSSLINSGSISGGDDGVEATTITNLINSGTITGNGDDGVTTTTITNLMNSGTITGSDDGVIATTITSLINSGSINGGDEGVRATTIGILINSGTITAGDDALNGNTITSLINSGTITSGNDAVEFNTITSLTNSGTITAVDEALNATTITSLTNSGKITGGTFAIHETGSADTLLTLRSGSDIFGAIDLGGGINTLVVGNGLSIDHVFANVPDVINSNGTPLFIIGNRVVVVDTSSFTQQDEQLFDLRQSIWGTVFNNIGDGRNPAAAFTNGPLPQFSLGAVSPGEIEGDTLTTHRWASVFGNHRMMDGDSNVRHNLSGLIAGLDGRYNSNIRLGAFFGASKTDIDSIGDQETEVENIFGGLYASFKSVGLTIDFGVTGGLTENESSRLVDNNQVDGLETVSSSFDGTFIAPELSISSQLNFRGTIFQPTLRVGYAGLFLDGYTETGASAPLTVGDRDLHLVHARFELAALMTSKGADSFNFTFSPYVGIEGRSLVGGDEVNVTLLGQNLSFTPGGEDDIASAFAGMRLSVLQTENFGIFAGFEGGIDTDENKTITGNLGLKWLF